VNTTGTKKGGNMNQALISIGKESPLLVTGARGFIGKRVVIRLLEDGYSNIRCFVRSPGDLSELENLAAKTGANLQIIRGNLLSPEDCVKAVEGVHVIYHLAAGKGIKSVPEAYLHSVVTTRNLMEAALDEGSLRRFVNVSSFAVYSNVRMRPGALFDESCPMEDKPADTGDAYAYAKIKQDEIVMEYGEKRGLPYVILRPGVVYGPGSGGIHGRIGIDTFGPFLHMGGSNSIPMNYVDNCAEAVVLAGLIDGIDGEIFNVVDDDLPTSRQFLKMYKKNVKDFKSYRVPKMVSRLFCIYWGKYSISSDRQLPPVFNYRRWSVDWKGNKYSNQKLKQLLGWKPRVPFSEASARYFEYARTL
jgi:nucleoside-diphosphate-sugar epimerase